MSDRGISDGRVSVVLARGDDWCAIYLRGKLAFEDHRFTATDIGNLLNELQPFEFESKSVDLDWLADLGSFPDDLGEVSFA